MQTLGKRPNTVLKRSYRTLLKSQNVYIHAFETRKDRFLTVSKWPENAVQTVRERF